MDYRIVLVNGYDNTRLLSQSLIKKGYKVTAINPFPDDCAKLATIDGLNLYCGDASKPYVLEEANVHNADLVITMSDRDEVNLVTCELCKKKFNVKKTVAIVANPNNKKFFEMMGVDSVVCAVSIIANIIEESVAQNIDIEELTEELGLNG